MKISRRVFELLLGHEIMTGGQTDRQTDGQTDGQGDYYRALPPSSGGALITKISINKTKNANEFRYKILTNNLRSMIK